MRSQRRSAQLVGFALLLATLLPAYRAFGQQSSVELDPAQTQVEFTLGATLHTVHGTFKLKHGAVKFDPATGRASGALVIDATSGDTDSSGRDHKMHNDLLESGQYPEITFAPQRQEGQVAAQGESSFKLVGTFSIHGAGHPMTLAVRADIKGARVVADTNFVVPDADRIAPGSKYELAFQKPFGAEQHKSPVAIENRNGRRFQERGA